jgi:hypothetical protein
MTRKHMLLVDSLVICLLCSGCSRAPSVSIIGSFFPVWMICLAIGVVLAFFERSLLLHYALEDQVGPLWLFYPCSVTLIACIVWLLLFR